MLTPNGPKVIEYNCRFGDPETQVVLPLLETDLLSVMMATTNGTLGDMNVTSSQNSAACVILASGGYPEHYQKGKVISGLVGGQLPLATVTVYHAGTSINKDVLTTSGGRVLGVTGVAPTLSKALKTAYDACDHISFDGMYKRNDIGTKATTIQEEN